MAYTKTNWVNGQAPAINATNLNKIEKGIYNAHVRADKCLPKDGSEKMTGNLEIEKAGPKLILDATSLNPGVQFHNAGTFEAELYYDTSAGKLVFYDKLGGTSRVEVDRTTGNFIKIGDFTDQIRALNTGATTETVPIVAKPSDDDLNPTRAMIGIRNYGDTSWKWYVTKEGGMKIGGDVDFGNNLIKNVKLGSSFNFNDWYAYKIGLLEVKEKATPPTPSSGYGRIYFKTDGRLYYLNDAGVEYGPL